MGSFSIWHWLVVLIVVLLIFGTKKLRNIGEDLGSAVKGFKENMKESETPSKQLDATHTGEPKTGQTIESEANKTKV